MNILALIRRRKKVWILRLAAPFGVVWLSMLWQPCAMAMDADGGQHSPMHMDMHGGAHTPMDMGMDHGQQSCPHCPPLMHEDCEGNASGDCDYFDRFDADRRVSKLKFEESSDIQPILHPLTQPPDLSLAFSVQGNPPKHTAAPPGPALTVLYCSYLN